MKGRGYLKVMTFYTQETGLKIPISVAIAKYTFRKFT